MFIINKNAYIMLETFFNFYRQQGLFSKRMEMLPRVSKMQGRFMFSQDAEKFYKFSQDAGKFLHNFPCSVPEVSKFYQK